MLLVIYYPEGDFFVLSYLFVCRSLTYAQRVAKALYQISIKGSVVRTPFDITSDGCGYSVKIPEGQEQKAMAHLENIGLPPGKVMVMYPDGHYLEVSM